ncbi:MAG: hypothetical protein QNJ81_04715 [Acidimicrobiia bacterium]|nr:hypothetical protein [Acidimicrobiia bacterium]
MDAVEFCFVLGGRLDRDMPLRRTLVFEPELKRRRAPGPEPET